MDTLSFPTPDDVDLVLRIPSGDCHLTTADVDTTTISVVGEKSPEDVTVQADRQPDGTVRIVVHHRKRGFGWGRGGLTVRATVPRRTRVTLESGAADLHVDGHLLAASIRSGAGDVHVGDVAEDLDVKTASGDVHAGHVGGRVGVHSASGDVSVASAGDLTARSASGDISVREARGDVRATTMSGDVMVGAASRGTVDVQAVSGDVTIAVVPGTAVFLDVTTMSGSTRSDLDSAEAPAPETGTPLTIRAHVVSGDVHLRRATVGSSR